MCWRAGRVCCKPTFVSFRVAVGHKALAQSTQHLVLNLGDGTSHLLVLRFVDDQFVLGEFAPAVGSMFDALVACLKQVSLKLNASEA